MKMLMVVLEEISLTETTYMMLRLSELDECTTATSKVQMQVLSTFCKTDFAVSVERILNIVNLFYKADHCPETSNTRSQATTATNKEKYTHETFQTEGVPDGNIYFGF